MHYPLKSPHLSVSPQRPSSLHTGNSTQEDVRNGKAWAKTVDEPWDPFILCLDGGGIRGYSSLLILESLMHEIAVWEDRLEAEEHPENASQRRIFNSAELLPCHYFDFMYGTSTGGLIATMLGRLRMSVPQCMEKYRTVGEELFGRHRSRFPLATKYHHQPLEDAVIDIVRKHCPIHIEADSSDGSEPRHEHSFDLESNDRHQERRMDHGVTCPSICHTICLTATHNQRIAEAYLLRTYDHRYQDDCPRWLTRYNEGADPLCIWQVTRATCAAPFYFKALEADIRDEVKVFKDGGIRENNPAGAAWNEFVSIYGPFRNPGLLLSVGTGRPNMDQDGFASTWPGPLGKLKMVRKGTEKFAVFKNVLIKYTEGEEKHRTMLKQSKGEGENTWYKRLNVSDGLQGMKLDNWKRGSWTDASGTTKVIPGGATLTRIKAATDAYLHRDFDERFDTYAPPHVMIEQTAEKMVRHRRARERTRHVNEERWSTFMGLTLRSMDEKSGANGHLSNPG
ncbi:FabD/lysophospholipase-like protein [Eremomyces bilateralis CBS 781.70]|uniref:FabD/lysophospholipase-like protein n=1 Tax=Eremomyces bilateralis CBS 781.70 TaxID=1392243 RepID=A0A6G1FTH2_9PEZI|nr:FabD/lysophospholipase-like protein [Eremomyces bilateralis CBS 781.70]KAF1809053.1 FabD/lysophospholipase-like protein [Eremomyces bilateralis CBS 781.70]